ncbi:conserved hypothetical protein [Mesorhizobium sp. ORS 3359]|nr:conserved hypothetical protein [Mesorhizobium sp. ORS 3359]
MERLVEKKVLYFLSSRYRGREDVRDTLRELREYGRLVMIGGAIRDIALFGNAGFKSDLDLVIDTNDLVDFERRMKVIGARVNRFGGYALPLRRWQVDVWPLKRTWAHLNGHVRVESFKDLPKATFFTCDAVIYDLEERNLISRDGYFDELSKRVLEVNLLPNPNPKGNAVRAIRYSLLKGFRWGPGLAKFFAETVGEVGWAALEKEEERSFNARCLGMMNSAEFLKELNRFLLRKETSAFEPLSFRRVLQLELPLWNSDALT